MVLGESVRVTVTGVFKKRTYLNGLSEELYRQLYMQLDPPGVIITTPMNSAGAGCLAGLLLYTTKMLPILARVRGWRSRLCSCIRTSGRSFLPRAARLATRIGGSRVLLRSAYIILDDVICYGLPGNKSG